MKIQQIVLIELHIYYNDNVIYDMSSNTVNDGILVYSSILNRHGHETKNIDNLYLNYLKTITITARGLGNNNDKIGVSINWSESI